MVRITDGGWAKEDDPIFNGEWLVFSVHRPKPQANTDTKEKPGDQLPESPEEPAS